MQRCIFLLLATFLISSYPTIAQNDIPVDPSIRMGQLENGMRYYIKRNSKPTNKVALRLALKAGSIVEDDNQQGLAHFVEHMCFNGSANFSKNELIHYLESVGTRFGPDLNAYTSFDETVYMLEVRTDVEDQLSKGLLVMEDWAGRVSFDPEEIDKERGVVISEWRSRLSAEERMQSQYFPVMFEGSQYADRLPIGQPEIIENADYETIKKFYRDWYRPDLMALVIVGEIDVDEMEQQVIERFSDLKNPDQPRERIKYEVPLTGKNAVAICKDKEAGLSTVRILYKHKHEKVKDLNDYRQSIVRNLYNSMLNQRLSELQLQEDPPFIFAFSGYTSSVGDLGTYTAYAAVKESKIMVGLETLVTEAERVRKYGFEESELERAKQSILKNIERAYLEEDKTESSNLAMSYVYNFLEENPMPSAEQRLRLYESFLPSVTLSDVNQLAEQWIRDHDRVVIVTAPDKEGLELPDEEQINELLNNIATLDIDPFEDDFLDEPLVMEELTPVPIQEVTTNDPVGIIEWKLGNGVKVVLKPTDLKNDEVLLYAYSPGGTSLLEEDDLISARYATGVVGNSGLGAFNAIQLEKLLSDKKARVNPFLGETFEGFNGSTSPDDMETLLQLIYLYFTAPGFEDHAIHSIVNRERGFLENVESNPNAFFSRANTKFKFDNHPRRMPVQVEDLDLADGNKAYRIYKDRFDNAGDFTFFFVGNIDLENHEDLITKYLGNLPATSEREQYEELNIKMRPGKHELIYNKGEAQKSLVEITMHGDFDFEKEDEYIFQSMIDLTRIKLRETLREDMGGVYGVALYGGPSRITNTCSVTISFNADPPRTQELINAALEVLNNLSVAGPDSLDITKVQETQRQTRTVDLQNNRFWMGRISSDYRYGLDPARHLLEEYEKKIESLTAEDIQTAAARYFSDKNSIRAVLYPEDYSPFESIKP